MSKSTSSTSKGRARIEEQFDELTDAVVYYRCSSPQQELSVDDQRREVEEYAKKKGYRIVREYVDEGKSASKNPEKRVAFNRMIEDSMTQEFSVVLCYDAARFTRFDNIEGSTPKQILRGNGVILDTVKEGEFDWRTPEGRWKDMAFCEANKAAALNISRDCIRGRINVLKLGLGYWPGSVVPYGYDKEYTDGIRTVFVRRHEKYAKGRNWHLRLVVNDEEAAIIKEVFDLFVNRIWSKRQIAMHLTGKSVVPPKGQHGQSTGAWDADNITTLLTEKAYIGIASMGGKRKPKVAHNRMPLTEQANSCPKIVDDPRLWHEAQEIVKKREDSHAKPQSGRCGTLSGFLKCGHCGYNMSKREVSGKVKYYCTSAAQMPHLGCHNWSLWEKDLLPRVLEWLVKAVDEEVVARLQARPPEGDRNDEEALLRKQVESLAEKVKSGTESALQAPPNVREGAWKMVAEWQAELDSARQRLALVDALRHAPEFDGFAEWWAGIKEQIVFVDTESEVEFSTKEGAVFGNPTPLVVCPAVPVEKDRLRALLARLGFMVRVWWEEKPGRKQCQGQFFVKDVQIEAELVLRADDPYFLPASTSGSGRATGWWSRPSTTGT
jgi:DNA invertase Pin-like site-specific DNA recombinase